MKKNKFAKIGLSNKRGFTLIELLVVIVVISILSAVVLVVLSDARKKGQDAGVKANLKTISSQSGLFYGDNGSSFLPSGGSTFAIATCPTYSASGTNMLSKDPVVAGAIAEAVSRGGNGSSCYNSATLWSVAVGLRTDANKSWCVDSAGQSKQTNFAPGSAIDTSLFTCK